MSRKSIFKAAKTLVVRGRVETWVPSQRPLRSCWLPSVCVCVTQRNRGTLSSKPSCRVPVCIVTLNLGCLFLLQRLTEDPRRTGFACKDRQKRSNAAKAQDNSSATIRTKMSPFHVCSCSTCQKVSSNNLIHLVYLFIYRKFFMPVQIA